MRRYFFHFRVGNHVERDTQGTLLLESAVMRHAAEFAACLVTDPKKLCDWGQSAIEVEDEARTIRLILSMFSVLAPEAAHTEARAIN
jgi:hypothetical protein